jgi:O-antigen biosynthesis protein
MLAKIVHNQDIGGVGCKVIDPDGNIQHAGIAIGADGPVILSQQTLQTYGFAENFENYDRFFQACATDCFLMTKEDFKKTGGFSVLFHDLLEDADLCLRIRALKKKILYAANVRVKKNEY